MALKLPRLPSNQIIVDAVGVATLTFSRWWQQVVEQIESSIDSVLAAEAAAAEATATAGGAQNTANLAQQGVDEINLAISYVAGCVLTATDVGTDVQINVSEHTRVYGDNRSVDVLASGIAEQPYSTILYVYYVDPARTGGSVVYQASTVPGAAAQLGSTHTIGIIQTPASGGSYTTGITTRPPGVGTLY